MENTNESKFRLESRKDNFNSFISRDIQILPHIHYHMEIMYVVEGNITISINNETRELKQGELAFVFPNQLHSGKTENFSRVLFIIFAPEFIPEIMGNLKKTIFERTFFNEVELEEYTIQSIKEYIKLQEKYTRYCTDKNIINTYKAITIIIMSDMFMKYKLIERKMDRNIGKYQEIIEFINNNFSEKLTLDIIAHNLGINKYYISRLFEKEFHISFHEYVSTKRLMYAESQIIDSDKNITEILYESGFRSERTFYRLFKQYFGKTPMQVRSERQDEKCVE